MKTRARDIMTRQLVTGQDGMTIEEAIRVLHGSHVTGFPVVDGRGKLKGVVSEFDVIRSVRRAGLKDPVSLKHPVSVSRKVTVVEEDAPLSRILRLFVKLKVRRLPVVDRDGRLVGIISRRDIMRVLYYRSKVP